MARYTPEQRRNIRIALAMTRGDRPKVRRSLLEAMAVESNYRNLDYGDRDSQGVLQQRSSMGWGPHMRGARGVKQDIADYLQRARRVAGGGYAGTAGQLAQAVQRSAFPGRYDQRRGEVNALMRGAGGKLQGHAAGLGAMAGAVPGVSRGVGGNSKAAVLSWLAARRAADLNHEDGPSALSLVAAIKQDSETKDVGTLPNGSTLTVQGPVSKNVKGVVAEAEKYLGTPYKWGGSAPGGFDCSGLLYYTWGKQGVKIPRTSQEQWKAGRPVKGGLKAGDAVFFEPGHGGPGHVGMYIGNGRFIEAPHTGANVRISRLAGRTDYMGARRFV